MAQFLLTYFYLITWILSGIVSGLFVIQVSVWEAEEKNKTHLTYGDLLLAFTYFISGYIGLFCLLVGLVAGGIHELSKKPFFKIK